MLYLFYIPVLGLFLLMYFKLADQFNIIDKPNHRSSHSRTTIRGGGIVFPVALLLHSLISGFNYPFFSTGLLLISFISFYDDVRTLSNKIRISIHLFAVSLLFLEVGLFELSMWIIVLSYILVIGTINAYNFMDGINGITGVYSIAALLSLLYINETETVFVPSAWLVVSILSLLVFNFYNFRKNAKCFAGDVGSVSMAYIVTFFLLLLILKTGDLKYIGLLLFYGLDSITTIIFRIFRKENIFEAHRSHFYQYLTNHLHWSHLKVATIYLLVQIAINIILILFIFDLTLFISFCILIGLVFLGIRFLVEGRKHLLSSVNLST